MLGILIVRMLNTFTNKGYFFSEKRQIQTYGIAAQGTITGFTGSDRSQSRISGASR